MSDDGLRQAVFAAKGEIPALPKDSTNPHFGSRFTSLAATNEKVGPVLRKYGLLWQTFPTIYAGQPALRYRMTHVPTGEFEEDTMALALAQVQPQGQGSGLTYARRYSLWAYLDLIGDEDDDGNAAAGPAPGPRPRVSTAAGVDFRDKAKGLNDAAINAARAAVDLPRLERPWASLINIPPEKAEDFQAALEAARAAS